ncbi:osmoprotectant transport system substrate-binding protein [Gracilibacillus orientalis]|uniref:Osmoprotectant transport system substrate-binding protein n=1 Tax=Gracilibacillus orientalis TaxID=334253 RepID=A0A1I4P1R7_9BACI|nr:glycine betaine ABC transporter substrate-binding protein [Gracilibacillus orientalis]SFM21303.1 osmoprotectant transport system substrate-binding protein [Gracilibacillus orientalis]
MKKILGLLTIILLTTLILSACGDDEKHVTVGAKNFTEQFLIAKMTELILVENGFEVDMKDNLGSTALRKALENDQVDITWDYTGTGLVTYNDQEPIADKQEAYEKVNEIDTEENGITWTNLSEVNNTYTLVMRSDQSDELGIKSISDLAEYVNNNPGELKMATDAEFANRPDGLPGVYEAYGFEFGSDQVSEMSYGLNYDALNNDEVDVAVGFATDSRIREYDLMNLEDDQQFFPSYNAAISMTSEVYENYPEIEEIFEPLAEQLNSETMRELNYQVDVEERSVQDVAEEYLSDNGLLE